MTRIIATHDVSGLSDTELMKLEREIARKYLDQLSIPMVVWPLVNTTTWLALWPLVLLGHVPLWAGFLIATINITLSYLPSHDAQHDCYAKPGEKLRWLNEFIGHYSLIPLARGYAIMKLTHMEHHKHANNPELDPDYHHSKGQSWSEAFWLNLKTFQPGSDSSASYGKTLERLGINEAKKAYLTQIAISVLQVAVYFTCAAHGYALKPSFCGGFPTRLRQYICRYISLGCHIIPPKRPGDIAIRADLKAGSAPGVRSG